ncbi:hypothetical protein RI129_001267 [Pyrocoelia pectoralis]|uniref:Metalloendopeptidase n=1 Tax=Pyrocoelia pectoralis TaxID=417401 RepID=A0AAN7VV40_9COLE
MDHLHHHCINPLDCPLDDVKFDNDVRFARRRNGLSDLRLRWRNAEICYIISGDFRRQGGRQILNLGSTCIKRSTVLHESMHAAGFVHQQSNPNRDDYIDVKEENIGSNHLYNFDKFSPDDVTDYGLPYDVCSITHYDECAFSKNGQKTIVPKTEPNCTMGDIYDLSPTDKLKVNLMYNCTQGK